MLSNFKPNIHLPAFKSEVMSVDNEENVAHGFSLIEPGADGPPIHIHPVQQETFRVIKGELEVYEGNRWYKISEGEEIVIPKTTPHSFRSRSVERTYFEYKVTPKGNFTNILKSFETMMKNGKIKTESDLKGKIYMSMVFQKHKSEILSTKPPHFVVMGMAWVGKALGFSID